MTAKHQRSYTRSTWATLLMFMIMLLPAVAQIPNVTEAFSRQGKTEVYGIGQYLHSEDIKFNGPFGEVPIKMDDTALGGFGIAYHFNDFISVHGDFMFGNATFSGNLPIEGAPNSTIFIKQDAFIQTGRFNVDYNIINRRLTPYVTAGIGYQYLETSLNSLPPVNYCWWDPWWGYICSTGQPYASTTDFTWNAGAGVRWNITDNLFVKAMAGATWLEYSGAHGVTSQIEGVFSIGWSF